MKAFIRKLVSSSWLIKLYNIEVDPEELVDLYDSQRGIADELLTELKSRLDEANQPYL